MFDIGWSEMVFVAIIAVLVIGPKDLPRTIATVGKYIRKARGLASDFQSGIDDLARDAELDDLKKTVTGDDFNLKKQVENAVDPTGDFSTMFDEPVKKSDSSDAPLPPQPQEENSIGGPSAPEENASPSETKVTS
jgi:sec-independent protein translocase protein TatB